jgi:hypothetical protein
MDEHRKKFDDARFAVSIPITRNEAIDHLTTCIWELGFLLDDLHNVAHTVHTRLESLQDWVKQLDDTVHLLMEQKS